MEDRVLGDMPSEGSEGGRRFGIFRAYSPDPKMNSISRMRVLFVAAIAAVVSFAVFFPMIQYASRASKRSVSPPYPEIYNISLIRGDELTTNLPKCSTNFLSFGHDCAENQLAPTEDVNKTIITKLNVSMIDVRIEENTDSTQDQEDVTELELDITETRDLKSDRVGRSRWPTVSTPYPYYNLPKPTPTTIDRSADDLYLHQTPIFAIPMDMSSETYTEYSKPKINFTPPPYAFTPFPNFTDSYAQLSPYKITTNSTNFEDVMKYLKSNVESKTSSTEKVENEIKRRTTKMKVSGTYIMPLDRRRPDDDTTSESAEESVTFFNGHAYVADPFVNFRPSHPLDVNRLISLKPSVEISPRLKRPPPLIPIAAGITPSFPVDTLDLESSGSHTVAIFHPPAPSAPRPMTSRPTTVQPKEKPLSVTLDIYPVTMEVESEQTSATSTSIPGRERGRLNPKWRPKPTERPRWRPISRRPPVSPPRPSPDNHMIVHLNLFPSKRKPYMYTRRGRGDTTTESDHKTTALSGGQYLARSSLESPSIESSTEALNITSSLPLKNVSIYESTEANSQPESSALASPSGGEDNNPTTEPDHSIGVDNSSESNNSNNNSNNNEAQVKNHGDGSSSVNNISVVINNENIDSVISVNTTGSKNISRSNEYGESVEADVIKTEPRSEVSK